MITGMDIADYYKKLDRSLFMGDIKRYSRVDAAFPIGYGQTISQPSLVLKMTMMLELEGDNRVLEIGTGSGYQTAILAEFSSHVYTVERIKQLKEAAEERLLKQGIYNVSYKLGDGSQGWEETAPYSRIIVTAAAHRIPKKLIDQLAPGGRMVIPVGRTIQIINLISRDKDNKISIKEDIPVVFVKLIGDY